MTTRAAGLIGASGWVILSGLLGLAMAVQAAQFEDGMAAYDAGNYAQALRLLLPLAEQGDARAQSRVGFMYGGGQGVQTDYDEALKWLRKAAEQEHAQAGFYLGVMFERGRGVHRDDAEAARWYRKAAEQGHAGARYNLGVMYAKGQGVPKNYTTAYTWFALAKFAGDADAQKDLEQLTGLMTPAQVTEAKRRASEWQAGHSNN